MKFSVSQEQLEEGLKAVSGAIGRRSTLPILDCILLSAEGDGWLKLSATDLEVGINYWIRHGVSVEQAGSIAVPAQLLRNFVTALPAEQIDLTLDSETQTLHLACGDYEANIKCHDAEDFPLVPEVLEDDDIIRLPVQPLKQAINRAALSAAGEESRPILTGVQIKFEADKVTFIASDGFRLSVASMAVEEPLAEIKSLVIPANGLRLASRLFLDDEMAEIAIRHNQVIFKTGYVSISCHLLEGTYPDVMRVIPQAGETQTTLDTKAFLHATRVSHLFARDAASIVKLTIHNGDGQFVMLDAASADVGDNTNQLAASVEGEGGEIAFNAKYLIDALNVIGNEQVSLETISAAQPGVLRPVGDDSFIYVIMPMHLTK